MPLSCPPSTLHPYFNFFPLSVSPTQRHQTCSRSPRCSFVCPWTCQVLLALPGLWPCPLIWMDTFQLDWATSLEITAGFSPLLLKHTHALMPQGLSHHCFQSILHIVPSGLPLSPPPREKKMGEKAKMFLLTGLSVIQPLPFIHSCLVACLRSVPICLITQRWREVGKQSAARTGDCTWVYYYTSVRTSKLLHKDLFFTACNRIQFLDIEKL